jgi:hypothetical protein
MAVTAVLTMQEGVQSDVLVSMEGVRPDAGGSPVGCGVNEGSPAS